jgi:hypothetical protein
MTFYSGIKSVITLQLKYLLISLCRIEFTIINEKLFYFHVRALVLQIYLPWTQNYITFNETRLTV